MTLRKIAMIYYGDDKKSVNSNETAITSLGRRLEFRQKLKADDVEARYNDNFS